MKILALDNGYFALDWYMRCRHDGHDVKVYCADNPKTAMIGKGLIERVADWRPWMIWADLVFLADNTKFLELVQPYRDKGVKVVGPTPEAAAWELERTTGMEVFTDHGIEVPAYREFSSYDDAIAYVAKQDRPFVSKPCGDEPDKSLSYVAKSPDDLIFMLERWKRAKKRMRFILQEKVAGCEMAVGGWFGPGGFNEGWCENWEFKKLMNGDLGVACFDETTEVLTRDGWKYWPDVLSDDEFCTLKDDKIVYDKATQNVVADFDGDLIGWSSETVDILVTPNHNMYVQDDHARKPFFFEAAEITENRKRLVARTGGDWEGDLAVRPEFAALVGAYIADGHCHNRSVVFGNCPPHKEVQFTAIASDAGFEAKMYGRDLYINSKALSSLFRDFGLAHQKRVPQVIKDGSVETILAFLRGYGAGDGSQKVKNLIYTTVSKGLSDDLQEILLKVGLVGTINARDRRSESHEISGYTCFNRRIAYDVSVAKEKQKANLFPAIAYRKPHTGKIYCVTVPSHVIYVRRNGKPCWIGQTGEQGTILRYVKRSKLAEKVLAPLAGNLQRLGYVGYVDVNCIIDDKGTPWPLEFTMRCGYPTLNIQQALIEGDRAAWLADLLDGRDAKPFLLNKVAAGVVLSIPDFPYSHITRKDVCGIPVLGLNPKIMENIHPCEMMMGTAPKLSSGKVMREECLVTAGDYVLVASGTGDSVRLASGAAYRALKAIQVPNSPAYRTDIGTRLKKQLPAIQSNGYATGLEY